MEIKGNLKKVNEVVERTNFKSRKVWIDIPGDYPQVVEVEIQQDKVDMFNGVAVGAPVICHINLRGREWTGTDGVAKVFNSLVCWKVESVNSEVQGKHWPKETNGGSLGNEKHEQPYVAPTPEDLLPF